MFMEKNVSSNMGEHAQEYEHVNIDEKTETVKELESYDIKNLTPDNMERINGIIQDYLLENYPVNPELVAQIPEHLELLGADEFKEAYMKDPNNDERNVKYCPGFYAPDLDKILINIAGIDETNMFMSTMFHESLHFVSLKNGAGFGGNDFLLPDGMEDDDMGPIGQHTLIEGTTQIFARMATFDLGFEDSESMRGYPAEIQVMGNIFDLLPEGMLEKLYFDMPMDDIRIHIESAFESEESQAKISYDTTNGVFGMILHDVGFVTLKMQEALDSWDETPSVGEVVDDIERLVRYYYKQEENV